MRRMWWLAPILALTLVAAACSDDSDDSSDSSDASQEQTDESDDSDDSAEPETDEAGAADPDDEEAEPLDYDETIDTTFQDVHEYWNEEFSEVYEGEEWTTLPSRRIVAFDDETEPFDCGPYVIDYSLTENNAVYLYPCDTIAYDNEGLFPQLFEDYGNFSPALVISHETGHRVQGHIISVDDFQNTAESIGVELQADCFAGAWTEYVDSGESNLLVLEPGDLDIGIAGYLQFRDEPGADPEQQGAHGTAFDRITAFQEGYEQGPQRCAEYIDKRGRVIGPGPGGLFPYIDIQFEQPGDDGDVGLNRAIDFTLQLLDAYWPEVYGEYEPIDDTVSYEIDDPDDVDSEDIEDATCGDAEADPEELDDTIFYCAEENFVAWDQDLLEQALDTTGDFGVAALIAEQFAHAIANQQGVEGEDLAVNLYSDCLNGSWAGAVYSGGLETESQVVLSPGDLDEVVQAFLAFRDDVDSDTPQKGTAFQRVQAFRTGFFEGASACVRVLEGEGS
jgi:predicted metalloprotease